MMGKRTPPLVRSLAWMLLTTIGIIGSGCARGTYGPGASSADAAVLEVHSSPPPTGVIRAEAVGRDVVVVFAAGPPQVVGAALARQSGSSWRVVQYVITEVPRTAPLELGLLLINSHHGVVFGKSVSGKVTAVTVNGGPKIALDAQGYFVTKAVSVPAAVRASGSDGQDMGQFKLG